MKTSKILVLLALSAFTLGCGATVRDSTEKEREDAKAKMEAEMQTMQMNLPQDPSTRPPTTPGGGATTPTTP